MIAYGSFLGSNVFVTDPNASDMQGSREPAITAPVVPTFNKILSCSVMKVKNLVNGSVLTISSFF